MCGIAGWGRRDGAASDVPALQRMCDVQRYRGPDDSGTYFSPDGKVALGHSRLSIIDLSRQGRQPMTGRSGNVRIAYNGEVYNFRLLRTELESLGHTFRSGTDTEVVLRSYEQWGTDSFSRLNGMFAFAIYDGGSEQLILARDRVGMKPLYYTLDGSRILFASEIKSLLASGTSFRFQKEHVAEYFLFTGPTGDRTLFEGIKGLRPGTFLVFSLRDGSATLKTFYTPRSAIDPSQYEEAESISEDGNAARLRDLLIESVERHLVADVPVGTFCSGGVDSSLVTAIARTISRDVSLFHVSSEGYSRMDELPYARSVARHVDADLIVYKVDRHDLQKGLIEATYYNDGPLTIVNSVPMLYISRLARNHGVKVLLSGEGSDELFGGYDFRHRALLRGLRWARRLAFLPDPVRRLFAKASVLGGVHSRCRYKTSPHGINSTIEFVSGAFERYEEQALDTDAYGFVDDPVIRNVLGAILSDTREHLEPLLMRQDRMTMAASVECRLPFLDGSVVDHAVNLPLRFKIRNGTGKWLVKRVAEEFLPGEIVHRRKQGFPVPGVMLYEEMAPGIFADGFWENQFGLSARHCQRLVRESGSNGFLWYQLLMMELWGRIFLHNEEPEQVRHKAFPKTFEKPIPGGEARRCAESPGY